MATKTHTWDDWSLGDHGIIASIRAPKNSYSGRNAVVYGDGRLGQRCGLSKLADAPSTGRTASMGFFGAERSGFGGSPGYAADIAWFVSGATVGQLDIDSRTATACTPDLDETPVGTVAGVAVGGDYVYLTHANDQPVVRSTRGVFTLDEATNAPLGCQHIVLYGERLLAAATTTDGMNRVLYSEPISGSTVAEFDVALNFFDVGPPGSMIVGMWALRGVVYLALADGSWWLYSGVPGVNDTLRLAFAGGTAAPAAGTPMGANSVWFIGREQHYPSYFNGSSIQSINDQDTRAGIYGEPPGDSPEPYCTVLTLPRRGDLLILPGTTVPENPTTLLLNDDRWSRHDLPARIGAVVPDGSGKVLLTNGGGADAAAEFFMWRATGWQRPPDGTGPTNGRSLTDDGATIPVTIDLTEFSPDKGGEITVRSVLVDLVVYETPDDPAVTVTVTPVRLDPGTTDTAITKTLAVPEGYGSTDGDPVRVRFDLGQQASGSGVKVRISQPRGVAIDRVHLVGHEMEARAA